MLAGKNKLPHISVVIIGLDVEKCLSECISSVLHADYPESLFEVTYVDGGSADRSVEIAKKFRNVRVVELKSPYPTPGRGRNAGIAHAAHEIIQFLDADTVLHPAWLRTALPYLTEDAAAVTGRLTERFPRKNIYHRIANMEWGISAGRKGYEFTEGPVKNFGGIVLARKHAFENAGGYDEDLVAGEDPDLSFRVRMQGWTIMRINAPMVEHDINMGTFIHYCKRAYRSGHAYAEIGLKYRHEREKPFLRQLVRICLGALVPLALLVLGLILRRPRMGALLAGALSLRTFIKVPRFIAPLEGLCNAVLYCSHLSFAVYPQFAGVMRYLFTCMTGRPLKNRARGKPAQP